MGGQTSVSYRLVRTGPRWVRWALVAGTIAAVVVAILSAWALRERIWNLAFKSAIVNYLNSEGTPLLVGKIREVLDAEQYHENINRLFDNIDAVYSIDFDFSYEELFPELGGSLRPIAATAPGMASPSRREIWIYASEEQHNIQIFLKASDLTPSPFNFSIEVNGTTVQQRNGSKFFADVADEDISAYLAQDIASPTGFVVERETLVDARPDAGLVLIQIRPDRPDREKYPASASGAAASLQGYVLAKRKRPPASGDSS